MEIRAPEGKTGQGTGPGECCPMTQQIDLHQDKGLYRQESRRTVGLRPPAPRLGELWKGHAWPGPAT